MNDIDGADETHYNEAAVTDATTTTLEKLERNIIVMLLVM